MRAFAFAFLSATPEPVSPVLPARLLSSNPFGVTAEFFSKAESFTILLSPVREPNFRVPNFRVPPGSSLFSLRRTQLQALRWALLFSSYFGQNKGGPFEQWDSSSIVHSAGSVAGDEASFSLAPLAAEFLVQFLQICSRLLYVSGGVDGASGFFFRSSPIPRQLGIFWLRCFLGEVLFLPLKLSLLWQGFLSGRSTSIPWFSKDISVCLRPFRISAK